LSLALLDRIGEIRRRGRIGGNRRGEGPGVGLERRGELAQGAEAAPTSSLAREWTVACSPIVRIWSRIFEIDSVSDPLARRCSSVERWT
jgi:hypothetical protein